MAVAEPRGKLVERPFEPQSFEQRRTQGGDVAAQIFNRPLRDLARLSEARAQSFRSNALHHLQLQPQQDEGLRGIVMQLAADAVTLAFLGVACLGLETSTLDG